MIWEEAINEALENPILYAEVGLYTSHVLLGSGQNFTFSTNIEYVV